MLVTCLHSACDQDELTTSIDHAQLKTPANNLLTRENLLLDGTFETNDLQQFDRVEAAPHEVVVQGRYYRSFPKSGRVELNSNEINVGGSKFRAELIKYNAGGANTAQERWFGLSIRVPEDWRVVDSTKSLDIFFQIHDRPDSCEVYRNPPLALFIYQNRFKATIRSDSNACTKGVMPRGKGTTVNYVLNRPLIKGRWVDWVIHVKWSYKNDGLLDIWQDGQKVTKYRGPIGYNDVKSMYLKTGLYHIGNGDSWPAGLKRRVLYIDEIRMAGSKAKFADVKPLL